MKRLEYAIAWTNADGIRKVSTGICSYRPQEAPEETRARVLSFHGPQVRATVNAVSWTVVF